MPERAAVPKHCYVLSEMPKTLVGKIQKNVLRVDAIERMFVTALSKAQLIEGVVVKATDRGSSGFHVDVQVPAGLESDALLAEALRSFTIAYTIRAI